MVAEARNFLPRQLARLQNGRALRDVEFYAIYGNFRHQSSPPVIGSWPAPWSSNPRPDLESSILRQLFFAEGCGERLPHSARTPSARLAPQATNIRKLSTAHG